MAAVASNAARCALLRRAPIVVSPLASNAIRAMRPRPMVAGFPAARHFSSARTAFVKKYTNDHEWVELSEDGESATIGISTYAADALGEVVYVELPTVDTEFEGGDTIGAVESVKSASDILAPVSGTIVEANTLLEDKPGQINKSPEGEAWIAKIKVSSAEELDSLMDAEAYKAFTEEVGPSH